MRPTVTPMPRTSESSAFAFDVTGITQNLLVLPFDIARAQYARAVQFGLIERSMLRSRDFSRAVGAMEQFTLGPWARQV